MTGMLASVNSVEEARLILAEQVDIIDLKDPTLGALGGLDLELVREIVSIINDSCPISATLGDLPMQPDLIFNAVKEMAETGVSYIKIGFFGGENQGQVIEKLVPLTSKINLIAVLFADTDPDFNLIDNLARAGFKGIMLDTQDKTRGSLTDVMAQSDIDLFVSRVKSRQLISGLAGSLRLEDIPLLLSHQPHFLGFRGALCESHQRAGQLNPLSVRRIKLTIADCMI